MTSSDYTARLAGLILAPRKTITKVALENSYWLPLLVVTLALIGFRMSLLPELIESYSSPEFVLKYSESGKLTEAEANEQIALIKKTAPIVILFESPILAILSVSMMALIITLTGKTLFKSGMPFMPVFNMTAWTSIISAIPLYISIPVKLINPELDLPSNPAFFISEELAGSFFHEILTLFDVFMLWQIYLLSIGVSVLYSVNMQRSLSVIGTMFLIFTILNAMFKGFVI